MAVSDEVEVVVLGADRAGSLAKAALTMGSAADVALCWTGPAGGLSPVGVPVGAVWTTTPELPWDPAAVQLLTLAAPRADGRVSPSERPPRTRIVRAATSALSVTGGTAIGFDGLIDRAVDGGGASAGRSASDTISCIRATEVRASFSATGGLPPARTVIFRSTSE